MANDSEFANRRAGGVVFEGKVVLVTGAGRGIGEETARRFAARGARVVLNDVDTRKLAEVQLEIEKSGGVAMSAPGDVGIREDVMRIVEAAVTRFKPIDILINNAAIARDAFAKDMTEETWDEVIRVNLKGTFLCAQAVIQGMIDQTWGRIINTSSYIGTFGTSAQSNYAASKAGVSGLTKSLALELARHGVTVNCVSPGPVDTTMNDFIPKKIQELIKAMVPLKRLGGVGDVSAMHLFLASDDASYLTGQVFSVDGGLGLGFRGM